MFALAQGAESIFNSSTVMIIYIVIIIAAMYFVFIRPQKKEQKRLAELIASMEIGDSVLTTSGFYGVIIDIKDDVVVVEFGNNKNCRIPMDKNAVSNIEKADK